MTAEPLVVRDAGLAGRLLQTLPPPPADISAWMTGHTQLLKRDAFSEVGLLRLGDALCYLKFFHRKSFLDATFYRHSRAVRCFDVALQLADKGVPVPLPLACLRIPGGMLLLAEGLPDAVSLGALWQAGAATRQVEELLAVAGDLMAQLHRSGFAHGDCKWHNLLWSGERLYLVDLDGVRRARRGSGLQARDLARFTLDAEELDLGAGPYELFLDRYLTGMERSREEVVQPMMPILRKLRARHLTRYGERGTRLFGDD